MIILEKEGRNKVGCKRILILELMQNIIFISVVLQENFFSNIKFNWFVILISYERFLHFDELHFLLDCCVRHFFSATDLRLRMRNTPFDFISCNLYVASVSSFLRLTTICNPANEVPNLKSLKVMLLCHNWNDWKAILPLLK